MRRRQGTDRVNSPEQDLLALQKAEQVARARLVDGITEKRVVAIIWIPGFARALSSPSEILL
jgi:hypothetical protein